MAEGRFEPRDFINPPYVTCPKCGHDTFGVLIISEASYSRRCRDCWHMADRFPLPKLSKQIIYLDQYVVSNLMKLEHPEHQRNDILQKDTFWSELRALLLELREMQLICCPNSDSHEMESRIAPFNDELKKTYQALSSGIRFTGFEGIRSRQISELALAWTEGREPVFKFDPRSVLSKNPHEWAQRVYVVFGNNPFVIPQEVKRERQETEAEITRIFQDVWAKQKQTFEYWYDAERKGYQGHLRKAVATARERRAEAITSMRPDVEPSLESLAATMPSEAEALTSSLRHIIRFPRTGGERGPVERSRLERTFGEENRIADAPFVKLQALMFASLAMRAAGGQKQMPNQGTDTDITTVAHLLPYCDAMLMDNGCRSLLTGIPTAFRPADAAKVFSPNNRTEFMDYLRGIRASASPEHLAALLEVYGEDRATN